MLAGTDRTIFVADFGNDATGDGTHGYPFRSIRKALMVLPNFLDFHVTINCDDLTEEVAPLPLTIGPFVSSLPQRFPPGLEPGFFSRGVITIESKPKVLDTITAAELTAQNAEAVTSLLTLVTTKNYALDQFRGKMVRDASGNTGVIASNTAGPNSSIEITQDATFVAPIEIIEPSTLIRNTALSGSYTAAVQLRGCVASVVFNGIKFVSDNPSTFAPSVFVEALQATLGFTLCDLNGLFINGGGGPANQPSLSRCSVTKRLASTGAAPALFSCFVDAADVALRMSGAGDEALFWFENIFDSCPAIGGSTGIEPVNGIRIVFERCKIRNGPGDGVFIPQISAADFENCRIDNCAGDALKAVGPNKLKLDNLQGSGNAGIGVVLQDGSQASRLSGTAVTGAGGDYQVGGNAVAPVGSWVGFPAGGVTDAAAANPEFCRLF